MRERLGRSLFHGKFARRVVSARLSRTIHLSLRSTFLAGATACLSAAPLAVVGQAPPPAIANAAYPAATPTASPAASPTASPIPTNVTIANESIANKPMANETMANESIAGHSPTNVPIADESERMPLWTERTGPKTPPILPGAFPTFPNLSLTPVAALVGEPLREPDEFAIDENTRMPGRRLRPGDDQGNAEDLPPNFFEFPLYGYQGAGHDQGIRWLIANGNGLGIFSFDMDNGHCPPNGDYYFSVHPDFAIHWVSGPRSTDLPPRLYDLLIRMQHSMALNDVWRYDIAATIGFYTDFEGSARRGLRWPATAVLYYRPIPQIDFFAGVDILDRDDLFALPVAGVTWQPAPQWRFDFAFPKPRAAFRSNNGNWIYISGDIGGGSWAIERQNGEDDIATYRDYRIQIGTLKAHKNGRKVNGCIGVAFDRHLEYRLQPGTFEAGATIYWQWESDF